MPFPLRRLAALFASLAAPSFVLAVLLFGLAAPAQAANVVVNNCTPAGLKAAILAAGSNGQVTFNCTIGGPTITLTQTQTISRAITIDGGGVITLSGGDSVRILTVPDSEKATLLNLTLAHGSASQGGALGVVGLAVITNVTFISNSAASNGGAVAVFAQGTAQISGGYFYSNTALAGGSIANFGGLGVTQSYFSGNSAHAGGAIEQNGGPVLITGSTFVSNTAEFGGAIHAQSALELAGDEFDHNAASLSFLHVGLEGGGALFVVNGTPVQVRQSIFFSNTAHNNGVDGAGGAILNHGLLVVTDTLFNENSALTDGGALLNDASVAVHRSTFIRNSALGEGGAISNTGTFLGLLTSTLLTNTAGVSGGALADASGSSLEFVLLFNNRAPSGGAVRVHTGDFISVFGVTFYSNTATGGAGGAILANGDVLAANSTFVANDASASGSAIQASGPNTPTVNLWQDTIVSNTAASAGAAVRRLDGSLVLANSLLAFNSLNNCQGTITAKGNNLQFGSLSCGASIPNTDPLLGPLQDNGGPRIGVLGIGLPTLRPLAGSPAIDGGDDSVCFYPTDERGYLRAPPCDLGAIEAYLKLWLPLVEK